MPTKKQLAQERYNYIRQFIDASADQYYQAKVEDGFRHWAFGTIFTSDDVQDIDIIEATSIDGPDDFEIDGWYIPEPNDEFVVNLFQSKYRQPGTNMGPAELGKFLDAPNRILNTTEVTECNNEQTKRLHDSIMKMLKSSDQGCTINLFWVTSGTLSAKARTHAEQNASKSMTVHLDSGPIEVTVTLDCLDLEDLCLRHEEIISGVDHADPCNVEFQLESETYHQVGINTEYPTICMTVPVKQIIDAFGTHKYKIFQLNPRGPLGNRTKKEVKKTLTDSENKKRFHLLNNGITAICDSWELDTSKEIHNLDVRDFQIINGCQTTVTLWEARAAVQGDPSVLVTVKLIKCPKKLADTIANTTNTQAALKAEDNISNEPVQRRLQHEFGVMSPPWFYQIKRGEWSKMLGGQSDKEKYRDAEEGYRKLTSKEVAQAILAFAGFPGEAKDRIRDFLNKEEISPLAPEASINYGQIYTNALTAKQLLLPAVIQRKVWKQVADDDDDWLEYARFHIVWLIGVVLRRHYGLAHHGLFTAQRAEKIISEIDDWFDPMYYTAVQAISVARSFAQSMGEYPGHREYFRTPANYRAIESSLETILKNPKTLKDVTAGLPN